MNEYFISVVGGVCLYAASRYWKFTCDNHKRRRIRRLTKPPYAALRSANLGYLVLGAALLPYGYLRRRSSGRKDEFSVVLLGALL